MSLHHALGGTRNAGRHRPGTNGDRLIPAEHRVAPDWTPPKHIAARAAVPADATSVLYLPPDIDLAEVTP
ncbi:hypothetical protein ACQEVC_45660 [Plantactinospora sp. CA-294935]|uniref:hypothetical protein n=1 Tax=Plantactinospora sp. CA-294935 TaxID=3240012 RepID=UPI003D900316